MTYLCHIHIGPVQSFIAAGRRTQDLYVGSRLLSELARAGVKAALDAHADLLYPAAANSKSVPNLFAFFTEDEPGGVCEHVEEQIRQCWQKIAGKVRGWLSHNAAQDPKAKDRWEDVFDRQVNGWLELYWVAVPYNARDHSGSFAAVKRAMAQRKNARHFPPIEEPDWKCTLTGAGQALPLDWAALSQRLDQIILRPNERLGALAAVKRFAVQAGALTLDKSFPSTEHIAGQDGDSTHKQRGKELEGYFAVLHMDGDQMGAKLSGLPSRQAHQSFSQALAKFADETVANIVNRYDDAAKGEKRGRAALVYAGGDDVLALLPLRDALACADDIRQAYADALRGLVDRPTMSAGIAVVPSNYPLDIALELARQAEKRAKEGYGRDAVVVIEAHGTQRRTAGAKWTLGDNSIAGLVSELTQVFSEKRVSAKIGYDLSEMAYAMASDIIPAEARAVEVRRLLKRRTETFLTLKEASALVDALAPRLCDWGEAKEVGWESLAKWVILARFLASGGKE